MKHIIEHGDRYKTIKCENCGCVFGYTQTDLWFCTNAETNETNFYLECPECGVSIEEKVNDR